MDEGFDMGGRDISIDPESSLEVGLETDVDLYDDVGDLDIDASDIDFEPIEDVSNEESLIMDDIISEANAMELLDESDLDEADGKPSSIHEALNDPHLFDNNPIGDYTYSKGEHGKSASGQFGFADDVRRDPKAQLLAGGDDRKDRDDGGHLIGARYGGAPGAENLDAQDRDVNRRGFKGVENEWAGDLKNGDKVFANVENYSSNNSERPDATMGYSITEDSNGNRTWDAFSFQNASYDEQADWENSVIGMGEDDTYPSTMQDAENFDEEAYNEAMQEMQKSKYTPKK